MARVLTGIQSTGVPHLGTSWGNYSAIKKSQIKGNESFLFIADLHSLTQIKNSDELKEYSKHGAACHVRFRYKTYRFLQTE